MGRARGRIPASREGSGDFISATSRSAAIKLDITWLKDESLEDANDIPEPQDLAAEAITELEAVVDDLREIIELVEKEEAVEG